MWRSEIQRLNFIDSWILHLFVDFQMSISDSNMKDKYSLISISVWSLQDQFQNLQNFTTIVSISDYTCKNFGSSQFLVKSFEIWTIPYNLTENFCCWRVGCHCLGSLQLLLINVKYVCIYVAIVELCCKYKWLEIALGQRRRTHNTEKMLMVSVVLHHSKWFTRSVTLP